MSIFKFNAVNIVFLQQVEKSEIMGDTIDLTGDGGVLKTIVRRAKADAVAPSESLPLVDGMFTQLLTYLFIYFLLFHVMEIYNVNNNETGSSKLNGELISVMALLGFWSCKV